MMGSRCCQCSPRAVDTDDNLKSFLFLALLKDLLQITCRLGNMIKIFIYANDLAIHGSSRFYV